MKLSTNLMVFHGPLGLKGTIDLFSKVGFEAIDFNADLEEYYTKTHPKAYYEDIRAYAADKGIVFDQTHAPFPPSSYDIEETNARFTDIVNAMEHSAWLGAKMSVVHACCHWGLDESVSKEERLEYNYAFYKKLIPYAEAFGIQIAIENLWRRVTETAAELLDFVKLLNSPVFTICYDVGHAKLVDEDVPSAIRLLGKNIGCTHIHDNDGKKDLHTLPFTYTPDWDPVMQAFAESGYEGNFSYEAGRFVQHYPKEMLADGAAYMAKVGKHLLDRYNFYKK